MNTTLEPLGNGTKLTSLVTLLAVASAISVAGCHAHAVAQGASELMPIAATPAALAPETVVVTTFVGTEPVQPLDEKVVTPMETIGASSEE